MIQLSLDNVSYKSKPDKYGIIDAKKRASQNWISIELDKLARLVGEEGHAFIPAHLEGGMKAENCTGMQLFALDFDSGVSFEEIKSRCDMYGIQISFAYHTFSSSPEREKFRVVFAHETMIEDIFVIKVILAILEKIFPECDRACKNPDRIFLGGKELIYLNSEARMALVQLIPPFYQAMQRNGNLNRDMRTFCNRNKIKMVNNRAAIECVDYLPALEKIDGFRVSAIIHKIDGTFFPSFFIAEEVGAHQSLTCHIKQKQLKGIAEEHTACTLLNEFNSGTVLDHNSRFAILTNLLHIKGGKTHFLEVLQQYYSVETYEKWDIDISYMKGYLPQRCSETFCPYFNTCDNSGTIIDTLAADRRVYQGKKTYGTEDEARICLNNNLEDAYLATGPGIHLIRAQTALGKTTAYIDLIMRYPDGKFMIALPTNYLKKEVAQRLAAKIPVWEIYVTPSVDESSFFPNEIKEQIKDAHQKGLHNKTKEIIAEFMKNIDPRMMAVTEECEKIIAGMNAVEDQRVVVTTHALLLQMSEAVLKEYTVIVDEDILYLQILNNISMVSVELLEQAVEMNVPGYAKTAKTMLDSKQGEYVKIFSNPYVKPLTEDELAEFGLWGEEGDNLNDIALAGSFVKKDRVVSYFCPRKLHPVKYIILSATLNSDIYRMYFGKSMQVIEYPEVKAKYKGKVIQYTYYSLGRRDLSNRMNVFDFAREKAGQSDLPIITFLKNEKAAGISNKGMHFGNAIGLDSLKGKDMAVIGTPYKNEESYKLIACYLGADVNEKIDSGPKKRRVDYHGDNFLIVTYANKLLREVQLYSLESEIEQAVGRARVLREDCTVYVYSWFPCEQAEIRMEKYLDEKKL